MFTAIEMLGIIVVAHRVFGKLVHDQHGEVDKSSLQSGRGTPGTPEKPLNRVLISVARANEALYLFHGRCEFIIFN